MGKLGLKTGMHVWNVELAPKTAPQKLLECRPEWVVQQLSSTQPLAEKVHRVAAL
jgi:hypothetical protein